MAESFVPKPGNRGAATREAVMEKARKLFAEKGFHGTAMKDIAEAVGMLKGSLYYHIESKEQLLLDLLWTSVNDVRDRVEVAVETGSLSDSPEKQLRRMLVAEIEAMADHQEEIRIWQAERRRVPELFREMNETATAVDQRLREIIDKGIADGSWNPEFPDVAYQAIRSTVALFPNWYRTSGSMTPTDIGQTLAHFAVAILRSGDAVDWD